MFVEKLTNNINYSTKLEVCSAYNLIYNGVQYSNNEVIDMSDVNVISSVDKEASERKTKLLNVDTSCYEDITYNKKDIAIELFDEFDKQILSISDNIKRNYLIKNVVYRLGKKITEIQVDQSDILISLHKNIKQFDYDDKLLIRKDYEKSSLCYYVKVDKLENLNYAIELIRNYYSCISESNIDPIDNLFNALSFKINSINSNVTSHTTNKGLVFRNKRNFTILSKRKYGIYVRLLDVEDNNNILNIVSRTNYEPLCRYFKVLKEEDIDIIMPYIIMSYEISKYKSIDLYYLEKK